MNKIVLIVVAAVAALMFAGCTENVPYTVADHYFVRNDVAGEVPSKITDGAEFEKYFNMAAVMGENGLPTAIDFESQYVISVAKPETCKDTEIIPVSLVREKGGKVVFTYKVQSGEGRSYSIVPCCILVVDRKFDGDVVLKQE